MQIVILHLSDMHFCDEENFNTMHIDRITSALNQSMSDAQCVLIVISGDLSYSGTKTQYKQVKKFLDALEESIKNRYNISQIYFAIVPGNHDVDYQNGECDLGRTGLEQLSESGKYIEHVNEELDKQKEFYAFSNQYDCFLNGGTIHQKIIEYNSKKIQVNLINTAIFSSLAEDQGYHYLPPKDIENLLKQHDSDFVISIMHHPHHWYSDKCKKNLEKALYTRSDIIFVGHEHYETTMNVVALKSSVYILAGGMLCNKGIWNTSEFHVGVLDLNTRKYVTKKYIWNNDVEIYEEKDPQNLILSKNRYNQLDLSVKNEFISILTEDKYMVTKSNHDYFVFPLLVEEFSSENNNILPKEIDSMAAFMTTLKNHKKIIISGSSGSGKTILSGEIYMTLSNSYVTLFLKGSEVSKNIIKTFKSAFEDIYSEESAHYEIFRQTPKEHLAIVIDNIDSVPNTLQDEFSKCVFETFGTIVKTCQGEIDVDIKNRLKKRAMHKNFAYYRIEPFYVDKRTALVTNIVNLCIKNDAYNKERITFVLCDVLNKLKYLYGWNPEFIVQFAKYYCNNIGDATYNDGSIFSKVFESNIVQLIKPHARRITVDKVLIILDKIAYGIYTSKDYPISLTHVNEIIQEYNDIYASKIDTTDFLELSIHAKILKKSNGKYVFFDRNYLAYFTAREIKRKYLEDSDYDQINHVMHYSYSGLNADILLFITYITDNLNIIKMIMKQSESVIKSWEEFDLTNIDVPFLVNSVDQILPYKEGDKKIAEEQHIEQEKREVQIAFQANDETIFNGESETLDFMQEILRSISLMIILAKTLPSFEHLMKKADKEKCVRLIYTMPLKIFRTLATEINNASTELLSEIKNFHEYEFRKDKPNIPQLTNDQALHILKWEITSLLLELMNASISNATRENTNDFIDQFEYQKAPTYSIEHAIGLARRDNVKKFIREVENIFSEAKNELTKNLTQRVTKNFIVNSKNIRQSEIDRLNSKIFKEFLNSNSLLLEKERNKMKN